MPSKTMFQVETRIHSLDAPTMKEHRMYDDADLIAVAERLSPRPPPGSEETFARMIADLEAEEATEPAPDPDPVATAAPRREEPKDSELETLLSRHPDVDLEALRSKHPDLFCRFTGKPVYLWLRAFLEPKTWPSDAMVRVMRTSDRTVSKPMLARKAQAEVSKHPTLFKIVELEEEGVTTEPVSIADRLQGRETEEPLPIAEEAPAPEPESLPAKEEPEPDPPVPASSPEPTPTMTAEEEDWQEEPEPAPVTRKKGWEFTQVPTALILGWTTLGLKPIDLQVVLAVRAHWRPSDDTPPFPSIQTLADIVGVSRSTVQRSLGRMVEKGYLRKGNVPGYRVGTMPRTLDFSGLWNAAEKGCQA